MPPENAVSTTATHSMMVANIGAHGAKKFLTPSFHYTLASKTSNAMMQMICEMVLCLP